MDLGLFEFLVGLVVLFLIYYYLTYDFDFWKVRNIPGPKPIPIFGNFKDWILGRAHLAILIKRYYDEFKSEPMIGIYGKGVPSLILKDPDLIKDVLIKDFNVFSDRGTYVNSKVDPLRQNLVNLEHERWRPLRNKLSTVFTSCKLREMFYLILDCADHFEKYVEKLIDKSEIVECRELSAKYTTDVIGACALGFDTNALDEDSEFRKFGRALFDTGIANVGRFFLMEFLPMIFEMLGPFKNTKAMNFFVKYMKETVESRRKNRVRRNDFVDLLMDMQDQPEQISNIDFSDMFLVGQVFIFFGAGFETSSTTISNALYEITLNREIQDKLRVEIKVELVKNNGKLTYDSIKRMKYLDKVFKETLRKYPVGSLIQRRATAPYTFAGTKLTIPTDTKVIIPVWPIQRDPDIYPNPDCFDPERFTEENEKTRHAMHYLPFGAGPHNCIASRFANFQVKIGIIVLINKFKFDICDKTCIPYRVEPRSFVAAPVGGIFLRISKL